MQCKCAVLEPAITMEWSVDPSDDDQDGGGYYQPKGPQIIIDLYESLTKGEVPQYEGNIYPRREPEVAKNVTQSPDTVVQNATNTAPEKDVPEKTEFDFDTQQEDSIKRFTPRRSTNRVQPKKVAKMSNVFSDIMKYKKLDDEQSKEEDKESLAT